MFNKKKKVTERARALREVMDQCYVDFLRIRYLHFSSLAIECAKDFYAYEEANSKMVACRYYKMYTKKAEYYQKKLEEVKASDIFLPLSYYSH